MSDIHMTVIQKVRSIEAPEPPATGIMGGTTGDFFKSLRVKLSDLLLLDDAAFAEATSGDKWRAIMEGEASHE